MKEIILVMITTHQSSSTKAFLSASRFNTPVIKSKYQPEY
jgi:hypothetical protein